VLNGCIPLRAQAPLDAIHVSVADGTGIPRLQGRVREMLAQVREVLALHPLYRSG
jgi:hypothetical protein